MTKTQTQKLPAALALFKEMVEDDLQEYIETVTDYEDEDVTLNTDPQERLKDFIRYISVTREINLLDILNDIDMFSEAALKADQNKD